MRQVKRNGDVLDLQLHSYKEEKDVRKYIQSKENGSAWIREATRAKMEKENV